jgi:molybdenum cofactor cytidylyltransferase
MNAAIVLAAGAARRFGSPKQLAHLDGEPLVRRAARLALGVFDPVLVVLGHHASRVVPALADLRVTLVHNPHPDDGLGGSIACAIGALPRDAATVAILLADQPDVPPAHLRTLLAQLRDAPLAATRHATVGAPAVFARALFPALAALTGDRGARDLIAAHADRAEVPLDRIAARDIDTPADLMR